MSSAAILRPGIALGQYPQQEDIRNNWLDDTAASIAGFFLQHIPRARFSKRQFIAAVNAHEARMADFSGVEIRQEIKALRRNLYARGLESELVAAAFSIIRSAAERTVPRTSPESM